MKTWDYYVEDAIVERFHKQLVNGELDAAAETMVYLYDGEQRRRNREALRQLGYL